MTSWMVSDPETSERRMLLVLKALRLTALTTDEIAAATGLTAAEVEGSCARLWWYAQLDYLPADTHGVRRWVTVGQAAQP